MLALVVRVRVTVRVKVISRFVSRNECPEQDLHSIYPPLHTYGCRVVSAQSRT